MNQLYHSTHGGKWKREVTNVWHASWDYAVNDMFHNFGHLIFILSLCESAGAETSQEEMSQCMGEESSMWGKVYQLSQKIIPISLLWLFPAVVDFD